MQAREGYVVILEMTISVCLFVLWETLYMLEAVVGAAVCVSACLGCFAVWCDRQGGWDE